MRPGYPGHRSSGRESRLPLGHGRISTTDTSEYQMSDLVTGHTHLEDNADPVGGIQ